jgi:hypothetical protein
MLDEFKALVVNSVNVRRFLGVLFNSGGKPQRIVEGKERKHPKSQFISHHGF